MANRPSTNLYVIDAQAPCVSGTVHLCMSLLLWMGKFFFLHIFPAM